MSQLRFHWGLVLGTTGLFVSALVINECIFTNAEFIRGVNWMYLPAGIRLLCTLLFGASGTVGLLLASWLACFFYFFPDDVIRSTVGGIIEAVAPYLAYRFAQRFLGLNVNLENLTTARLLNCAFIYALFNGILHHIWFAITASSGDFSKSFAVMLIGDMSGSVLVLYIMKSLLALVRIGSARRNQRPSS